MIYCRQHMIRLSFNKTMLCLILIVPRTPLNCYSKKRQTSLVLISGHQTAHDLNPVDYKVWDVMQQLVYECHMNSLSELKQRLVDV